MFLGRLAACCAISLLGCVGSEVPDAGDGGTDAGRVHKPGTFIGTGRVVRDDGTQPLAFDNREFENVGALFRSGGGVLALGFRRPGSCCESELNLTLSDDPSTSRRTVNDAGWHGYTLFKPAGEFFKYAGSAVVDVEELDGGFVSIRARGTGSREDAGGSYTLEIDGVGLR